MKNWKIATALIIGGVLVLMYIAVAVGANRESAFHDEVRRIALAHGFTDGLPSANTGDSGYYLDTLTDHEWSNLLSAFRASADEHRIPHWPVTTRKHGGEYCEYLDGDIKYQLWVCRNDDLEVQTGASFVYYSQRVKWYEPIARRLGFME